MPEAGHRKLEAARDLGLPVVMIERPPEPEVPTVAGIDEVVAMIEGKTT